MRNNYTEDEEESKESIKKKLDNAKQEVTELGGLSAFTSGEWLFRLILKAFRNYWERANAEYFRKKYSSRDDEFIAKKLTEVAARNAALIGAATGAVVSTDEIVALLTGGEGGLGIPANVAIALTAMASEAVLLVRLQLKLVANLGKLYGVPLDPDDPEDILIIFAYAVGGSVADLAGRAGMKVGGKLAKTAVRKYISKEFLETLKRIGAKLGVKILQRTIIKYTVPLISIVIGAGWNYISTRAVGKIATEHFIQRREAPLLTGQDIVCFSRSDWDLELVSNRYHTLTRFARRNRVVLLEAPFELLTLLRPTGGKLQALRKVARGPIRRGEGLYTIKPLALWSREGRPVLDGLNRALYGPLVRRALAKLGVEKPILWFYDYRLWPWLDKIPHKLSCYHCTEDYVGLAGRRGDTAAQRVKQAEAELLRRVDLVFAVSEGLREAKARSNPHTYLVPNGVDLDLYQPHAACGEACTAVARLPKPTLGYAGNITYKIDFGLLDALARRFPGGSIVMVGPVKEIEQRDAFQRFRARPNVHFLGSRDVRELAALIGHFDVCLIPFIAEDWFVRAAQPLKTYEYLACGRPVVSTWLPNLAPLGEVVYLSRSAAEFLAQVERALKEDSAARREQRLAAARANGWETLFASMNAAMVEHLGAKGYPA